MRVLRHERAVACAFLFSFYGVSVFADEPPGAPAGTSQAAGPEQRSEPSTKQEKSPSLDQAAPSQGTKPSKAIEALNVDDAPELDALDLAIPSASTRYESLVVGHAPDSEASASRIENHDFDLRPLSSPNDLLNVVPGLLAVQHQGGGKADQLFLRGFDADHGTDVGVFVDGVPINMPSHTHGQGYADLHWIIPEAIERIDVEKGSYDPRYGDFATAGTVNLITRGQFPESSVQMTLGGFPTEGCKSFTREVFSGSRTSSYNCKLLASERFVGIAALRFTGWAKNFHPWVAFEAAHDDGPFDNPERLQRYNLFAKLSYDFTPRTSAGMFLSAYGSGWIGSGQIPAREVRAGRLSNFGSVDPSEGGLTQRQMLTAFVHHRGVDDQFDATAYFVRYRLALWNDFTFFLEDPVNGDEIEQDDARAYTGARLEWRFRRRAGRVVLNTSVGAGLRYDGIEVDRWDATSQNGDFRKRLGRHIDTSDAALDGNDVGITQLNVAGWIQEDIRPARWFRALAALRADYFGFGVDDHAETLGAGQPKTSGTAQRAIVSPKATLVFTPVQRWLDLYLNFGMGFHTNQAEVAVLDGVRKTLTEADGSTTTFTVHAVPRIYSGEVGARFRLWDRLVLSAAFWASYLENETVFDADAGAFAPSQPTRRLGFDLSAHARVLSWLQADLDLSQSHATAVADHGNGGAIALAPRLYLTSSVSAHWRGLRAGLGLRYLASRPAFDVDSPEYQAFIATDPDAVTAQGYAIVATWIAYRWRFLEASLAVQNLINSKWREAQFGNSSCTYDEAHNPANPNYAGQVLADGTVVNRCGVAYGSTRTGVVDVHYTPGVPLNLQFTLKAYF